MDYSPEHKTSSAPAVQLSMAVPISSVVPQCRQLPGAGLFFLCLIVMRKALKLLGRNQGSSLCRRTEPLAEKMAFLQQPTAEPAGQCTQTTEVPDPAAKALDGKDGKIHQKYRGASAKGQEQADELLSQII